MLKRAISLIGFDGTVTNFNDYIVEEPLQPFYTFAVKKPNAAMTKEEFNAIARNDSMLLSDDVCKTKYQLVYVSLNRVFYAEVWK